MLRFLHYLNTYEIVIISKMSLVQMIMSFLV